MNSARPNAQPPRTVMLVAPQPPPYGGVGLQAVMLAERIRQDGFTVTFLPSNPPLPSWLSAAGRIPALRTLLRCAIFAGRLWRTLPATETVHIFACSWTSFFVIVWPAVLLGRLRLRRVVMNYHGGEAGRFLARFGLLARPAFRLAHVVTAPSGFLAEIIQARTGVPVEIVPNVVDLAAFSYRERKVFAPRMLVTRHLEKLYDLETVLMAFRQVQSQYPEASLWIAGTGSQENRLRGLVNDWKLRDVRFLGHVPFKELPAIYQQCEILLNASRADNFPGSLLEAAAAGLAVISTGVGGIPYIFENGKTALLVDPGDWRALAAAVVRVLEEPELGLRLSRRALEACSRYAWQHVRRSLYRVYGFELANFGRTPSPQPVSLEAPAIMQFSEGEQ
jgi:L-malate glycosyltransferase